jgi:hypothetical protein
VRTFKQKVVNEIKIECRWSTKISGSSGPSVLTQSNSCGSFNEIGMYPSNVQVERVNSVEMSSDWLMRQSLTRHSSEAILQTESFCGEGNYSPTSSRNKHTNLMNTSLYNLYLEKPPNVLPTLSFDSDLAKTISSDLSSMSYNSSLGTPRQMRNSIGSNSRATINLNVNSNDSYRSCYTSTTVSSGSRHAALNLSSSFDQQGQYIPAAPVSHHSPSSQTGSVRQFSLVANSQNHLYHPQQQQQQIQYVNPYAISHQDQQPPYLHRSFSGMDRNSTQSAHSIGRIPNRPRSYSNSNASMVSNPALYPQDGIHQIPQQNFPQQFEIGIPHPQILQQQQILHQQQQQILQQQQQILQQQREQKQQQLPAVHAAASAPLFSLTSMVEIQQLSQHELSSDHQQVQQLHQYRQQNQQETEVAFGLLNQQLLDATNEDLSLLNDFN